MSEAIEKLRAQNRHKVTLESGRNVTLQLPRRLEYIAIAKSLPTPILNKAQDAGALPEDAQAEAAQELMANADMEDLTALALTLDKLVNLTVKAIEDDGADVEFTPEDNAAEILDEDECFEIVEYAQRRKPLPKASGSTSSDPSLNPPADTPTPPVANGSAVTQPISYPTTSLHSISESG